MAKVVLKTPFKGVFYLAGTTRLERAAFCVTGRRSNQLSYAPKIILTF